MDACEFDVSEQTRLHFEDLDYFSQKYDIMRRAWSLHVLCKKLFESWTDGVNQKNMLDSYFPTDFFKYHRNCRSDFIQMKLNFALAY